ncbi:MAG: lamin tail domain-containing protein [Flavobacterium sp. JAD_PAG50586_2]|nr:MAG: lamin tail domain-containing protein [Flavobacterium sp. JAD_PAG50586_2]
MKTRLQRAFFSGCLLVAVMFATAKMSAQVTLPGTSPYSENFNSTPGASGTSYPTGWTSYNGTTVDNTMAVGNSSSTSGGNYNFASRIGILGSGSAFVPSSLVLRIANTTGKAGLSISYNVVKIREQARSNSFNLEVSTTSATAGFTAVTGGTYASGTIAEGTATAYTNIDLSTVDNTSGNVWIRWSYTEISGSGSRDAIALDDVVLSWTSAPTVTTNAANTITASSAKLNGTVNANGNTTTTSFNWGLTTSYGSSVTAAPSPVTGTSSTAISATISSLQPDTQYNFRAVGTVSGTPTNGSNVSFYTLANTPGILTVGNPTIATLEVTVTTTTQNGNPATTKYAIREAGGNYVQANGSLGATAVWQTAAVWATITVTGLDDDTLYSFDAKARNTNAVETAFGTAVSGTTLLNTAPTLTGGTLTAFGPVCLNTPSATQSFTFDGINMTTADITVGPLAGYTFSATSTGTYTSTLTITPATATISETVYVIFEPTAVASYNGNISIEGGGAPAINIAASGSGINTASTVTMTAATDISASTADLNGNVTSEGCSPVVERGVVYSINANPVIGGVDVFDFPDAGTGTGAYTLTASGLIGGTLYNARGYSINDGGISYSANTTFTTDNVIAPVATAATDITYNSFTANWDASEGAASYKLDVSESATFGTASPATDLFFSEYVEGSSTNKYLEIFNGTGASVNLSDYRVKLYSNGSTTATGTSNDVQLSGTLADGATVVLRNSGATVYTGTATIVASVNFNGNDAVALYKISTSSNVDIFGRIGEDPGSAWTSTSNTTVDKTLVRKSSVNGGVTVNPTSGFPTLETEWDMFNQNNVTNLGSHTFAGTIPSFVSGYENLTVAGTSQAVTGLTPETTYYYRVRAVAGNTSGNSNVITVTTTANTDPTLFVTELPEFGNVCIDAIGGPNQMTVSGINLTTTDITVGPAVGFSFSETATGTYTDSLTLTQAGGTYSQDIFVRFEPTDAFPYNADIEVAGGGAAASVFAVAIGEGVNTTATVIMTAATDITASTADLNGEVTLEGCSAVTERGVVYSINANPEIGGVDVFDFPDSGTGTGVYTLTASGLIGGTLYNARAYAINNGGISYSANTTFTTEDVIAPVATAATAITSESFTANWDASEGAASYKLDVSESATFGTSSPATDLFFSEYVEGSSTNKYLEIFNGTGASIDLSDYRVKLYSNGSTTATGTSNDVQLSGTLADGATVVLRNSGATIYTGTATIVASVNFNGDDAIALYKISTSSNVDIFGRIGEDPGSAWTSTSNTTVDKTLVRKSSVTGGVTTNPTSGFPTLETEWNVFNQNDVTNLGSHTFAGSVPSFVIGYENLAVSGTSQTVTGLNPATTYYYRVRAVAGNVSGNSNTISVTTDAGIPKTVIALNGSALTNEVSIYGKETVLNIQSSSTALQSVQVYDIAGRELFAAGNLNTQNMVIDSLRAANQVLIVKAITVDNKVVTKKVRF